MDGKDSQRTNRGNIRSKPLLMVLVVLLGLSIWACGFWQVGTLVFADPFNHARAVAVGYDFTVGLRPDGTVNVVGYDAPTLRAVSTWTGIATVAYYHTVALDRSGEALEIGARGSHILVMPG